MTVTAAASGIVLAGGRSRRFGADKLRVLVDGQPLVRRPVAAVAAVCREVLVVVPPLGDPPPLGAVRDLGAPVRFVHDPEPYGGPLVGLLAGLERASEPIALAVAGDMPTLAEPVLLALLRRLDDPDADAVALVLRGRRHPVPVALRVGAATSAARALLADGERSLAALLGRLRTAELREPAWRPLDPDAATLRDIDRPEDLGT